MTNRTSIYCSWEIILMYYYRLVVHPFLARVYKSTRSFMKVNFSKYRLEIWQNLWISFTQFLGHYFIPHRRKFSETMIGLTDKVLLSPNKYNTIMKCDRQVVVKCPAFCLKMMARYLIVVWPELIWKVCRISYLPERNFTTIR